MSRGALTEAEMNRICEEESRYDFYKKHSDPSMGDITLMKSRTSDEVICCKEYIKNSKEQFAEAILEAQNRLRLNNKYLIEMKNYSTRVKNDFCSTFYSIKLFYEYQPNNLQKEIRHRRDKGQDFSSLELTHLLYNIVEACSYLQDQGRAHGDIRPSSIAVLADGNSFKLIDRPETTVKALAYQQSLIYSGKDIYVPPALWMALKKNNSKIVHSEYATDVFSFGLCILEAGLKKPVSSIYTESGNYKQELDRLIGEFSKKYGDNPMLVTTLTKMLTLEESGRPDFKAIIKAIPPYADVLEYFDQEDQYDDTFTSNNFGQDYGDQYYDPNLQGSYGGYPQQPQYGAPQHPGGYGANPYGYQQPQPQYNQYGQPVQVQPVQPQAYGQFAGQNQLVNSNPVGYGQQPVQGGAFPQQGYAQIANMVQGYSQAGVQPQPVPQQQPSFIQANPQTYGAPLQSQPQLAPQQPQNQGYQPQQPLYTPQNANIYQNPAYGQYGASTNSQASLPTSVSTNTSYAAPQQEDGEIKVINGVRYREVKETRNEVNELGQNVRKIIVKLQPIDDGVKVGGSLGAPVSGGYAVTGNQTYVNAPSNYVRQGQGVTAAAPAGTYGGQVVYR